MRFDPEDPERDDVSRLEVARDDSVNPERDDVSRLEEIKSQESILIIA